METRKRSIVSPDGPIHTHKRQKIRHAVNNLQSKMCTDSCTLREKAEDLLTTIFQNTESKVWLRILPEDGKFDDISTVTNIKFEQLSVVMAYLGLIQTILQNGRKIFAIKQEKWRNLAKKGLFF